MIELNCQACGNNRFSFPEDPDEPVVCQVCGDSIGSYSEVAQRFSDEIDRRSQAR